MSQIFRSRIRKSKRLRDRQRQNPRFHQSSDAGVKSILCEDCKAVDWSSLDPDLINRRTIRSVLSSHAQLLQSECEICRAIALIKPPSLDDQDCELVYQRDGTEEYYEVCPILFVGFAEDVGRYSEWRDNGCLAVLSHAAQRFDIGPRVLERDKIDFDFVKGHLRECERSHRISCGNSEAHVIDGLRVINCSTGVVQSLPRNHRYFALSYVWGSPSEHCQAPSRLGQSHSSTNFPRVVIDAMSVTKSLGFRFLWVDKYVSYS